MRIKMPKLKADQRWLDPIRGLEYHDEGGYFYNEKPVPHRMTEVISNSNYFSRVRNGDFGEDKQVDLLISLDQGNTVHKCMNEFVRGRSFSPYSEVSNEYYGELVNRLVRHWIWDEWEAIGSEYMLLDVRRKIAGTCDLILRHKQDHSRIAIADLKTKKHKENKDGIPIIQKTNHKTQLGGYINLLNQIYPELSTEDTFIIFASPTTIEIKTYDYLDCLEEYEAARSLYFQNQEDF